MLPSFSPRRALGALALLAALPGLAVAGCDRIDAEGPIYLGIAGPPAPDDDQVDVLMGAELARRQINARGGIRGRPLEFVVKDDGGSAAQAVAVAEELLADRRVVAVVGHVNSGTTLAAAPVYNRGLAAVATNASSPEVSEAGEWIFRVASSDSANAVALARYAHAQSRRIGVVFTNEEYGRALAQQFSRALQALGGTVVESDPMLRETGDVSAYLGRMQRKGVDLVFLATGDKAGARVVEQAREVGFAVRFLGSEGLEGLVTRSGFDGVRLGLAFHVDQSPLARSFSRDFRQAYGREPDSYPASGYDAVVLLARAVETAGPDRARIRDYLATLGRAGGAPAFEGVTGVLRMDPRGDPVDKPFPVAQIRGGRFVLEPARP